MYQYGLPWFTKLVLATLAQAAKSHVVMERLEAIHNHFTASLFSNVCRWVVVLKGKAESSTFVSDRPVTTVEINKFKA
jgi:hypothetical protein